MGRNLHKNMPLEMRWRAPDHLPPPPENRMAGSRGSGGEVEIAFLRFNDDITRITVTTKQVPTQMPHPTLANVTVIGMIDGWEVLLNGDSIGMEPVSFLDAVYAGLAVFVEAVPRMAQLVCRQLNVVSQTQGWNRERMELIVRYGDDAAAAADA